MSEEYFCVGCRTAVPENVPCPRCGLIEPVPALNDEQALMIEAAEASRDSDMDAAQSFVDLLVRAASEVVVAMGVVRSCRDAMTPLSNEVASLGVAVDDLREALCIYATAASAPPEVEVACECIGLRDAHERGKPEGCEYYNHHCDGCHKKGICTAELAAKPEPAPSVLSDEEMGAISLSIPDDWIATLRAVRDATLSAYRARLTSEEAVEAVARVLWGLGGYGPTGPSREDIAESYRIRARRVLDAAIAYADGAGEVASKVEPAGAEGSALEVWPSDLPRWRAEIEMQVRSNRRRIEALEKKALAVTISHKLAYDRIEALEKRALAVEK